MKKIFRKAITVLGSAALIGATVGAAAAASYPSPFTSNTAIVVGANAAPSDNIAASSIASNLDAASAGTTGGLVTSTTGDIVSLDNSGSRIYLNKSLNVVKTQLSRTELPVVLADTTFSGNVDAKVTSRIYFGDGDVAGGDNSNRVIFTKQPKSSNDPVIGISVGTNAANYLYNATSTFKTINFSHADSEGEAITLFGRDFIVSTTTDTDTLVLFSSAKEVNLVAGGASANPSETVVIDDVSYTVELVTGTSSAATIAVNGESKEINEGSSKKVNGIDVAVKSVTESTALDTVTASILVGANKLTFDSGSKVTQGSDNDPIDGTQVYFAGTPGTAGMTELTVQVFRTGSSEDAILPGTPFVDPVFGSFKIDFAGLNFPIADTDNRDSIIVRNSGDKTMTLELTDSEGYHGTADIVYNQTGDTNLADESGYNISVIEMENITIDQYVFLGNEDYGHLLKVTTISNNTGTTAGYNDRVTFEDVITGEIWKTDDTSTEGTATLSLDTKSYTVTYDVVSSDDGSIQIKYPSSESGANNFVVYPTMKTEKGANVALYEPLLLNLGDMDSDGTSAATTTLKFPDGDGYTSFTATGAGNATTVNWTIDGSVLQTGTKLDAAASGVVEADQTLTVGQLTYSMNVTTTVNKTWLYLNDQEDGTQITAPAVVIFEEKDDNNEYHAVIVKTEDNPAGTGTSGIGTDGVLFSSDYYLPTAITLQSDSDLSAEIDWFGTYALTNADDSDQAYVEISYPDLQVYAQVYVGDVDATVGEGGEAGVMTVLDTAVSTVAGKNLIVVGGSAINSVAADLLGGAYREAAFTTATGVAAGEFLIESFARSGKTALLVAGYNAADTEKATTYLLNNDIDTTVGKKYKGTSATEASLVVA